MDAKELFKGKMESCPVTRGACGFYQKKEGLREGTCWKTGSGTDIRAKDGGVRGACPHNPKRKPEKPEQVDWVNEQRKATFQGGHQ